jgi:transcriptional regulator with XRE-family HTH domain
MMMNNRFDAVKFIAHFKARRGQTGLRDVARQMGGISPSTLSRLERGSSLNGMDVFVKLCNWMGVPAGSFFIEAAAGAEGEAITGPSNLERIEALLRTDTLLDPRIAEAIVQLVRGAYGLANGDAAK